MNIEHVKVATSNIEHRILLPIITKRTVTARMLAVIVPEQITRLTYLRRVGSGKIGRSIFRSWSCTISSLPQATQVAVWCKQEGRPQRGCCYNYTTSTPIRMARIRPPSARIVASVGKPQHQPDPPAVSNTTTGTTTNIELQQSGSRETSTTDQQNGRKTIDDEWDEFRRTMDPDSFEPFPFSTSLVHKAEPWKTILEYPARAAWRVASTVPPPSFQYAHQQIIQNSIALTKKQTARKYLRGVFEKTILEQQHALLLKRDRERTRILNNTTMKEIDKQREAGILPLSYGPSETMALYYFRAYSYFSITQRILLELQSLLSNSVEYPLSVRRIYDFGIGTGSATAAAIHVFPPNQIEWIHGVDPSETMRDSAKFFLQEFLTQHHKEALAKEGTKSKSTDRNKSVAPLYMPQMTFSAHASAGGSEIEHNKNTSGGTLFDLSILSYTAMELSGTAAILGAAAICYDKLRIGGIFIMIEPGTPDGFTNIRTVRNMLLDCFPEEVNEDEAEDEVERDDDDNKRNDDKIREVCHVVAPCTHSGRCPMERYKKYNNKKQTTQHDMDDTNDAEGSNENDDDDDQDSDDDNNKSDDDDDDNSNELLDDDDGIRKGYCSFVHSMPGGGGKGEKFSYLVVQKRLSSTENTKMTAVALSSNQHNFDDVNIPSLIQDAITKARNISDDSTQVLYSDKVYLKEAVEIEKRFLASDDDKLGLELVRGDKNRHTYGRIVRAPKKHRGHVLIDTCVAPGKIARSKISRSLSKNLLPGVYAASRKARWGGFWPNVAGLNVSWRW